MEFMTALQERANQGFLPAVVALVDYAPCGDESSIAALVHAIDMVHAASNKLDCLRGLQKLSPHGHPAGTSMIKNCLDLRDVNSRLATLDVIGDFPASFLEGCEGLSACLRDMVHADWPRVARRVKTLLRQMPG